MKLLLLFSCTMLLLLPVMATDTLQYSLRHYTDENGLPQNSIKAIAPDKSGFVWLATENGLVRFDGQWFRTFDKSNMAISSGRITWMRPDPRQQNLLAVTEKNQLIRITGGVAGVHAGDTLPPYMNPFRYDGNYSYFHAIGLPNIYKELIRFDAYSLTPDADHYFSITTNRVDYFRGNRKIKEVPFHHNNFWGFFLANKQLYHLDGYQVRRLDGEQFTRQGELTGDIQYHPAFAQRKEMPALYWNLISGNVFVRLGQSLYLVKQKHNGGLTTQLLLENFDFETNKIISVFYDELHKRLFLGSHTRGLFVLTRKQFYTLKSAPTDDDEVYYAQTPYGPDKVLTPLGDVLGLFEPGKSLPAMRQKISDDRTSLLTDPEGNIWGKQWKHLYRFNATGTALTGHWEMPENITRLFESKKGTLLVGIRYGPLYELNYSDENARPSLLAAPVSDVSYMQLEKEDLLWVGTSKGLYRLQLSTGRIDTIPGLADKYIRSIYISQPGEIWITTSEDGFFLYKQNRLVQFPFDKGRYLTAAHCILEDENGYFWITTNKGLFQVAKKDLLSYAAQQQPSVYYLYYDKHAGFNTNEFNGGCQPCGLKLENGYLSFPSINGLVWIKPGQVLPEIPDKGLFIDKVEVDGRSISCCDTFTLSEQFDFFKLFVTTPYFGNANNVQLDFALVKNQHAPIWNKIDNDRSITLTALPSGTYQLMIRKINGFGNSNYLLKTVTLVIPLAYYETWWFRAVLGVLLVAGFWMYTRMRFRYIKRKNKMLEKKIDERTQTLLNTLTDLQESEESLRRQTHIQERLITAITHDIKSPLKYMTMAARRLFENATIEPDQKEIQKNARMLYESGYRMYHLTDNLLQYIKLNSRDTHITYEQVDVFDLADEKVDIFRDIAAEQSTTLVNEIPPQLFIRSNNRLLGVVIHNLLDNAVKVTFDGQVKITSVISEDKLHIRFEDTGVGMHPDMIDWCNRAPGLGEQDPADLKFPGHAGFGLIIVKELVALMNGRLHVSGDHQSGMMVEIIFDKEMLIRS